MLTFQWFDLIGYGAAAFNIYAAVSKTMIRLRGAAIAGNTLALTFAIYNGLLPNILVNAVVLPLNSIRLLGMVRQIRAVQESTQGKFNIDWLKPFMEKRILADGEILFQRGDTADRAYYIRAGTVYLPEINVLLPAGQLFGEMGMIMQGNARSQSAIAHGSVELLCIEYRDFKELALQNPEFGFYLMRLIVQRLEANQQVKAALPA